eukprot:1854826-Amphidinium_carterae.1
MSYDAGDVALLFGSRSTDSAEENLERTLVRHLGLRQSHRGVVQSMIQTLPLPCQCLHRFPRRCGSGEKCL